MAVCDYEFNFYWIIENYSYCFVCISSPQFSLNDIFKDTTLGIDISPRGYFKDEYTNLCVNLSSRKFVTNEIVPNVILYNADKEVISALDKPTETYCSGLNLNYKMLEVEELEKKLKKTTKDCLIVRVRVSNKNNSDVKKAVNITKAVKTVVDFEKHSFSRDLNTFDGFSSTVVKTRMADTDFKIRMEAPEDDVLIEIKRLPASCTPIQRLKCQIYLLNHDKIERSSSCDLILCSNNTCQIDSFFKKSFLKNRHLKLRFNFFVSNGKKFHELVKYAKDFDDVLLKIVSNDSVIESLQDDSHAALPNKTHKEVTLLTNKEAVCRPSGNPAMKSLQDDFHAMLSNEKYKDVKLLTNKETMMAHKVVLASRSPVFSAMFDQDMVENQTGTVNISDVTADTMKLFLKFLYTGVLDEVDCETALELLLAAEKYQVPSLKEKCSEILISVLDAENACSVLSTADMVNHAVLKSAAMSYIQRHAAKILSSPKWTDWIQKNMVLGSEIFCKFSNIITAASFQND